MVQKSGSRLSGSVKKSVRQAKKSGSITGAQAKALRQQLRTPGVSARETKLVAKATGGNTSAKTTVYAQQATRSKARAAGKMRNAGAAGGRPGGKPAPGNR